MTDRDPFAADFSADTPEPAPGPTSAPEAPDPFEDDFRGIKLAPATSTTGALVRGAERSLIPAVGSLPAIGGGAALGAELGAPLAPFTAGLSVPGGAIIGGIGSGLGAGYALSKAQEWVLSKLPSSWVDKAGLSESQRELDEKYHPAASFIGGLAPYAITMKPWGAARALPENATTLQRIMAHPLTSRLFSGGVMGGLEAGQEVAHGESPDWTKIAISTGFGMVFNRPNRIGETLENVGGRPVRWAFGRPEPTPAAAPQPVETPAATPPGAAPAAGAPAEAAPTNVVPLRPDLNAADARAELLNRDRRGVPNETPEQTAARIASTRAGEPRRYPVTLADAADMGVMGPGITEETFHGSHQRSPEAQETARQNKQLENSIIGAPPEPPPLHALARRMHPELFGEYDRLQAQRAEFARWIDEHNNPTDEVIADATARRDELQRQLDAHLAERGGYAGGPEAHRLRANIRDAQREVDGLEARRTAYSAGQAEQTPELIAARQHLLATDYALHDMRAEIQAAYRRAAEAGGHEIVEPETVNVQAETPVAATEGAHEQPAPRDEVAPPAEADPAEAPAPVLTPVEPPKPRTIEEQRDFIRADVARQLERAGRPKEEAAAAGALTAARYETRAALFKGARGTAEDLYREEGSEILGPGMKSQRPTPPRAPRKVNPEKLSLVPFLAHMGGISASDPMIADLRGIVGTKPYPGLIRSSGGMTLDRARELAAEAGYIENEGRGGTENRGGGTSTVKTLLDAVNDESRGRKRYQPGQEPVAGVDSDHEEYLREQELAQQEGEELFQQAHGAPLSLHPTGINVLGVHDFDLVREGEKVGSLRLKPSADGKDINIKWITSGGPLEEAEASQLNVFGPGAIRDLARELKERFPKAETVSGLRTNPVRGERRPVRMLFQESGEPVSIDELMQDNSGRARGGIILNPTKERGRDWLGVEGVKPILRLTKEANASTFIHESGHQFLAELLRDAEHEAAPDQLKADAETTLKWLGAKSAEDLQRKHHEKFATGFEQYLREGTAPSAGLARVFAQFRQWLVKIYQTIKGLGQPINEDIRQVFDRMLAEEPQRTVIAPEREIPKSLGDTHAEDAALTAPEQADAAKARVDAERRKRQEESPHEPEIEREASSPAELGGEAGRDLSGNGPVSESAPQPASEQGSGGARPGNDQELPSIPPAGGEGNRVAGRGGAAGRVSGEESDQRDGLKDHPLAPGPADTLDGRDSFNVGKKGNIRTENITSIEQFGQAIEEAKDRIPGTDEPMTDGQLLDAAQEMGFNPDELTRAQLERAFGGVKDLNKKILAFRMAVRDQAEKVSDLMRQIDAAGGTVDQVYEYAKERQRFDMFMSILSSVTTEWGRAGRAFRNLDGWDQVGLVNASQIVKDQTGLELFQLKMEAKLGAKLDSPAKVAKYLRDAQKRSFGGMLLEYFVNNLISGPATHMTYMVGNKITAFMDAIPDTLAASAIGAARRAMGRQGERVLPGESWQHVKAIGTSLPKSIQGAIEAVRTGQPTLLPGQTARPLMPFFGDTSLTLAKNIQNDPVSFHEVAGDFFGAMQGIINGIHGSASLIAAGGHAGAPAVGFHWSPLGQIPDIAIRGVPALPVGSLVRLPGRIVSAIHSFDTIANYSRYIAARAYREGVEMGKSGAALSQHIATRTSNPPTEWMEEGHKQSYSQTLMGPGGEFVHRIQALVNWETKLPGIGAIRPLKFVDPFVHIGANIIGKAVLERTPLGILSGEIRNDLLGKNGNVAQDYAQARMLMGTAMSVGFGYLAMQGYITGSGPSDRNQNAAWREVYQPHSIRIGDMWYQVNRLGPLGMHLGIAADLYEVARDVSEGDMLTAAAHLQHAITQNILDESFMRGPSDLIKALDDPGRYGEGYIRNIVGDFVPFAVGVAQMNRAADPYTRQARTVMDAIMQRLPGQSFGLQPRINVWGEEIPSPDAFGHAGLTAIYEKRVNEDPVRQAMLDLGIAPAPVPRSIRNVDLTDEEYTDFARIAGRTAKMWLDRAVRSPDWQRWPANVRHNVVVEVIRQSREAARGQIMMKYPHIPRDAVDDMRERKLGEPDPIR